MPSLIQVLSESPSLPSPNPAEYLPSPSLTTLVDTEFADKLVNKENSSYQYTEENEDVDENSIEDFKGCFAKIDQHGRMEEKASVEAKVPYVFQTDNICLIAVYTI